LDKSKQPVLKSAVGSTSQQLLVWGSDKVGEPISRPPAGGSGRHFAVDMIQKLFNNLY